jgi:hypothetical protein
MQRVLDNERKGREREYSWRGLRIRESQGVWAKTPFLPPPIQNRGGRPGGPGRRRPESAAAGKGGKRREKRQLLIPALTLAGDGSWRWLLGVGGGRRWWLGRWR